MTSRPRRLGTVAAACLAVLAGTGSASSVAVAQARSVADPPNNTSVSNAFWRQCDPVTSMAACDAAALPDFDTARAAEGLAPMTLPNGFDGMPVGEQVWVLANIDRVDHGLPPIDARSARLDGLAQQGADGYEDPPFPSPFDGDYGGGNWAGVSSSLLAEFLWMYDDGPGGPNEDCTSAGDSGCWGHRHNILHAYDAPRLMGTGEYDTGGGADGSIAEEFIGGDKTDSPESTTWSDVTSKFPIGLSTSDMSLDAQSPQAQLQVWASGEAMNVTAAVAAGSPDWSVTPTSCNLAAGTECTLTVTWDGSSDQPTGTLTVSGPNGSRDVSLTGTGGAATTAVTASARVSPRVVHGDGTATLRGRLVTAGGSPLSGQPVTVEAGTSDDGWQPIASATTDKKGAVSVAVQPTITTSYRLAFAGGAGYSAANSQPATVTVAPIAALGAAAATVASGHNDRFTATVTPAEPGQTVWLQQRSGHDWTTIASGALNDSGKRAFVTTVTGSGQVSYRVVEPATPAHRKAVSAPLTISVR